MIAMIGIIWAHTPNFDHTGFSALDNVPAYFFFMDFFKFGVICFFLISGFLLARTIDTESPLQYLKRRVYSTFLPYIFAFTAIVLLFVFKTYVLHIPGDMSVGAYIVNMFLNSALWFLPNYWISLLVILCFRKFLRKWYFGAFLLLVTAGHTWYFAYSAHAQSHVHALFAFIFYLWLGYYIGKKKLHLSFQQFSLPLLLVLSLAAFIASGMESVWLYREGSPEPMNILKVSNQLYSLIAFVTMVRIFKRPLVSTLVNPRKETFGIYLYHMFALVVLTFILKALARFGISTYSLHTPVFMAWFIVKFLFVYIFTLGIVKVLLRYNIGFLNYTGRKKADLQPVVD